MPVGKFLRMYFSAFSLCEASIRPSNDFTSSGSRLNAVDQIDRVETRCPLTCSSCCLGVAHHRIDVDVAERHLVGEVQRHHHHAGDQKKMMSLPVTSTLLGR